MKIVSLGIALALAGIASPARAQVAVDPSVTTPAAWTRYGLRVINQNDTPTVAVRIEVPAAIMLLGVEDKPGWTSERVQMPDSGPAAITWRGGTIRKGEYAEFPFLGRLPGDARQEVLVMPVRIERANGTVVEWRNRANEEYAAPRVEVVGTVRVSSSGALMIAALAMGIAILAVIIAIARGAKRPG